LTTPYFVGPCVLTDLWPTSQLTVLGLWV